MKKTTGIISLILVLVLAVSAIAALGIGASAAAQDISVTIDTGAEITLRDTDGNDYYEISTADELFAFAAAVNGGNYAISGELMGNIDANPGYVFNKDGTVTYNGATVTEGWREWIPVGRASSSAFRGNFNGNYYTVSGLYTHNVTDTDQSTPATSFIGYTYDGVVVENVGVENSYFRCDVTEGKSGHSCNASGLVFHATAKEESALIRNCWSTATVYAYANAGGFVTTITKYTTLSVGLKIENCLFGGYISGRNNNYGLGNTSGAVSGGYYEISNTYYDKTKMSGNKKQDGGAIPATTEQFANGFVAFNMGGVFGQNVDNGNSPDSIPVFDGPRVYRNGICSSPTYSNTEGVFYHDESLVEDKYYDENDLCLVCGGLRTVKVSSLTVGEVQVVIDGVVNTTSGTGWTYDHVTRTLTFEDGTTPLQYTPEYMINVVGDLNISVNGTVSLTGKNAVINSNGKLVIELNNNATLNLTARGTVLSSSAIDSTNDVTLKGSGTINATGSQSASSSVSVTTDADIFVDGVTLNALGKGNYYDISAVSLIVGRTAPATVNCISGESYAISLDGDLEVYNGSSIVVADKYIEYTASIIYAEGNVIISDSTVKFGHQKTDSWINIFRTNSLTVSGRSHIIVDSITSNSISIVEGKFKVDGNYYLKTDNTSEFVYKAPLVNKNVTSFELVTEEHLVYTYKDNGTHKRECKDCSYHVIVQDDIPCTWTYSASENEMVALCDDCGAVEAITINPPANLTYDGEQKGAVLTGVIPGVSIPSVLYMNGSEACDEPKNAGIYTASIILGGATASVEYTVEKAIPNRSHFETNVSDDITYNGEVIAATVSTASGVYGMGEFTTVIYKDGVVTSQIKDVGEYKIAIQLLEGENYKGADEITIVTFAVKPYHLDQIHVGFAGESSVVYNGENQKPDVGVAAIGVLDINEDYTLSWDKDEFVNAGTYTVTVKGIGNYMGEVTKTFEIKPKELSDSEITIDITEVDYNGEAYNPTVGVTDGEKQLVLGQDYTLAWDKDGFVNAGTYTVAIEGIGNYSGSFTRQLVINKIDPQIQVRSPISSILPGNSILLTVTSISTELPTPVVTGTNFTSDGLKITVNNGLVIGHDTVEIVVSYAETENYLSGSDTVTLEIGMVDFSGDIENLRGDIDAAVEELNARIESGDSNLSAQIEALNTALTNAKYVLEAADGKLKTDLEKAIADGDDALNKAIKKVAEDLAATEEKLNAKIESGDSNLSAEIDDLAGALESAKTALEAADATNRRELIAKIDNASSTLNAAIKAVQKNLDDAKAELHKAIKDGDSAIEDKIDALNKALVDAKAALEAIDEDNKSELSDKIHDTYTTLDVAIKAVQNSLDSVKAELAAKTEALETKDRALQTLIIIVCVVSGVTLCGGSAFVVWFFLDRKKNLGK